MSDSQRYRYESLGHRRQLVAEHDPNIQYVDRDSGTDFMPVGLVLPLAPSQSKLAWTPENLRLCGCSREQLVQKDLNDCPYCERRMPALKSDGEIA